jgi:hypothetical protein
VVRRAQPYAGINIPYGHSVREVSDPIVVGLDVGWTGLPCTCR